MQLHWSFLKPNVLLSGHLSDKALQWVLICVKSSAASWNVECVSAKESIQLLRPNESIHPHGCRSIGAVRPWCTAVIGRCVCYSPHSAVCLLDCAMLCDLTGRTCFWINILTLILTFPLKSQGNEKHTVEALNITPMTYSDFKIGQTHLNKQ